MRPVALLLAALLALTAPVGAQEDTPLLEDPAGDVVYRAGPAGDVGAPGGADRVDVRSLHLVETPTSLEVTVALQSMDPDAQVTHSIEVTFDYAGVGYGAFAFSSPFLGGYFGYVGTRDDATGRYSYIDAVDVAVDPAAATVHLTLPREHLVGADGAPLVPGRSLTAIHVHSEGNEVGQTNFNGQEVRYPSFVDEAGGAATLPIQYGVEQTGHAHLASETPYRSSNGAATTFVYRVDATNTGDAEDRFILATEGVPDGWDVTVPVDRLVLEPGDSSTVPVVVRTPFAHQHGSAQNFLLTMTSDADPGSVGRVELGVRYPAIPQPAGHHDTLWLHGMPGSDDPFSTALKVFLEALAGRGNWDELVLMNTLEEEDRFEPIPVKGYACGNHGNGTSPLAPVYCWDVPLDPRLDMGLDFDLSRTGRIEVPVHALVPTSGARLAGALVWLGPVDEEDEPFASWNREVVELAHVTGGAAKDIGLDGTAILEATLTPLPEADLVEYQSGAGLQLRLRLETDRVDYVILGPHEEPELMPGGLLQLPLLEYADPVKDVFTGAGSIRLDAVTPQERLLNPGDTAVFTVDVAHRGDGKETYTARVVGGNVEWASLLGPTTFTLGPNGTQRLSVSVVAPDDARDEDQADLVLEVSSTRDLSARSLVRLLAIVDTDAEHADDAEQAKALAKQADKKSPGPGAGLLGLVALAAVAARAPRRRA